MDPAYAEIIDPAYQQASEIPSLLACLACLQPPTAHTRYNCFLDKLT